MVNKSMLKEQKLELLIQNNQEEERKIPEYQWSPQVLATSLFE
jgi:hypothetical protein